TFNTLNGFTAAAAKFELGLAGVVDLVGGVTITVDSADHGFAFTWSDPQAFVGFGGGLTGSAADGSDWAVSSGTGFTVNGTGGQISVYALNGQLGVSASGLSVSLSGITGVTTNVVGFSASYNDGTDFSLLDGQAANSTFNTLNGFTAAATKFERGLAGVVDLVGGVTITVDSTDHGFALTWSAPQAFVCFGGGLTGSAADGSDWAVSAGTGFTVNGAGGQISVYALNGPLGVSASGLSVSLSGITGLTTNVVGFSASYNDGTD